MSTSSHQLSYASPPVTIILTIILLLFFFIGFFSVYFCRCFLENLAHTWILRRSPSGSSPAGGRRAGAPAGLHPSIVQSFPTFPYSTVKGFRRDKCGLDCAICLSEFGDDSVLRLLAGCCHAFHQECIDLWLDYHKTCPVCRRALDEPTKPASSENPFDAIFLEIDEDDEEEDYESMDDTFSIDISRPGEPDEAVSCSSARSAQGQKNHSNGSDSANKTVEKFPRSHSTGHSISRSRGEEDRFTLRLPEHVKVKIARGRSVTERSRVAFGVSGNKTEVAGSSRGFGEASLGGDVNMNKG